MLKKTSKWCNIPKTERQRENKTKKDRQTDRENLVVTSMLIRKGLWNKHTKKMQTEKDKHKKYLREREREVGGKVREDL